VTSSIRDVINHQSTRRRYFPIGSLLDVNIKIA